METNFETIVKSMSAKEIIMAMVDSLTPPPLIKINMNSFGMTHTEVISDEKKFLGLILKPRKTKITCYGCAATNTICKIAGKPFTELVIGDRYDRADFLNVDFTFLKGFEWSIDALRRGDIDSYNLEANSIGIAKIISPTGLYLPRLEDDYTVEQLDVYRELADAQL